MSSTQQLLLGEGAGGAPAGYQIERSLRFNSADSAYLNRTLTTPTSNTTWTYSLWVKRGVLSTNQGLLSAGTSAIEFVTSTDTLRFYASGPTTVATSTAVFRDASAWYHFVISSNGTTVTAYRNNVSILSYTGTLPQINSAIAHRIGSYAGGGDQFDGYLTEVNFIDGQALTPSSFGQTDPNTGVWQPIKYTGTYGTNGFYLNFSDNSGTTATTLGKDSSGNGNNWTPNNFSVTAGAGNDSMVDTPTPYGTDTGVGGEVRGNYATLNPLTSTNSITVRNGNLDTAASSASGNVIRSTLMNNTGKWYFEAAVTFSSTGFAAIGVVLDSQAIVSPTNVLSVPAGMWLWRNDGYKINNGSATAYGTGASSGDIIMVAYDADAGKIWFGLQGTWFASGDPSAGTNESFSGLTTSIGPCVNFQGTVGSSTFTCNFGQRPFAYTAPSGFKALCTQNLPTPTIGATSTTQANRYFDVLLETGTGSARNVTGLQFAPDFLWAKGRNASSSHLLYDTVRGVDKSLNTNNTLAEDTTSGQLTSFNSNGYSLPNDTAGYLNFNGRTYAFWNWNAGGSNATNTQGSITSTVRANTTAGFSILTYTGTGTAGTIGHGLGVAPQMIIVKNRNTGSYGWFVWHTAFGAAGNTDYINLNLSDAKGSGGAVSMWNTTMPTSSVFSVGTYGGVNGNTNTYVTYCFAAVPGYSAFGSYTGNGSADGPFVYTGFRPRYLMIKESSSTGSWTLLDTARSPYNAAGTNTTLWANLSDAEGGAAAALDILSNGFKIRDTDSDKNTNAQTYIYAAFAENPFKYSLAR